MDDEDEWIDVEDDGENLWSLFSEFSMIKNWIKFNIIKLSVNEARWSS